MGGTAFSQAHADGQPTLNTPRMNPSTYIHLKSICVQKLEEYFPTGKVCPLIEAPEKKDYGDLDIFVAVDQRVDFTHLANHLGAAGVIRHDNTKATFAIPADGTASKRAAVAYSDVNGKPGNEKPSVSATTEEYAQVDLAIVLPESFDWYTFYSSYSDLAGMLGHIVTNLGFTVSDTGFSVRLPELDFSKTVTYANISDRDGTVFLSSNPNEVISFLGCSVENFQKGFTTREELYAWLGECRLISPSALEIKRNKATVRRKERNRPIFSTFFKEWLPAHKDMQTDEDEEARKEKVVVLRLNFLYDAVRFFTKQAEHETKYRAALLAINNGFAAHLLKPIIAQHSEMQDKHVNEIVKAFRRWVVFDAYAKPGIAQKPHADEKSELHKFLDKFQKELNEPLAVGEWVNAHWEELRGLERQRAKLRGS